MSRQKADAAASSQSGEAQKTQKASAAPPKANRRRWPWVLGGLVLLGAASWLVANGQWRPLELALPSKQVSRAPQAPVAVPPPASKPKTPPPSPSPAEPLSHEEAKALMQAIDKLTARLEAFSNQQETLREAMQRQQRMNLELRLRWIADPASRLPEIAVAWQEIALLPMLADDRREQADRMRQIAEHDSLALRQWRATLRQWSDQLAFPVYRDVLPKPEQPWLAWIVGQFHLRKAPSVTMRERAQLRDELLALDRALAAEQWPEPSRWQRVRARLALLANGKPLNLPEAFDEIRQHKAELQQAAANWLSGGL